MIGEGRGEILTEFGSLPKCSLLLVNPGIHVPTGKVFFFGKFKVDEARRSE